MSLGQTSLLMQQHYALKSGNAVILRGGSEAINSNMAFYDCIKNGLINAGLDQNSVQLIEITDREAVTRTC